MNNARTETIFNLSRVFIDGISIYGALIAAYFLRMKFFEISFLHYTWELFPAPNTLLPFTTFQAFAIQFTFVILLIFALKGRYRLGADEKIVDEIIQIFWALCAGMAVLLIYFFFAKFNFFSRLIFGVSWIFAFIFIIMGRILIRTIRQQCFNRGIGLQKILLLGTGQVAQKIGEAIVQHPHYEIVGILSEQKSTKKFLGQPIFGTFSSLAQSIKDLRPHEIWLMTDKASEKLSGKLIKTAHINHKKFKFIPDELSLDLSNVTISTFSNFPIITLSHHNIEGWAAFFKSLIDLLLSILILFSISPLLLIISILIWAKNPRAPLFYTSERVGRNGEIFDCYKFRTMVVNADELKKDLLKQNQRKGGVLFKIEDDPRITPIGHFLRKYSLDELPQLFNVLKLEMSLIGPRPHLKEEVAKYPKEDLQILSVKPGITGFAQINGRSSLSFEEEMRYEMFYLKNWSMKLDIIIFIKSIFVVFKGENAS